MSWNLRYAIISYIRSTIWIAPVIALALEQATWRIAQAYQFDFGYIPGFVMGGGATIAAADYAIAIMTSFVVFTFGSLLVAIQVASGQLSPRIIATTLLRDTYARCERTLPAGDPLTLAVRDSLTNIVGGLAVS